MFNEFILSKSIAERFQEQSIALNESSDQQIKQEMNLVKILHLYKQKLEGSIKLQNNIIQISEQVKVEQFDITLQEIQQVIEQLKKAYSGYNLNNIIKNLYFCLVLKKPYLKNKDKNNKITKFSQNISLASRNIGNVSKRYILYPNSKQFKEQLQKQKQVQRQIVAKSFYNRNYGIRALLQQIKQAGLHLNISKKRYTYISLSLVLQSYRKLQEFLIQQCNKKIIKLNQYEMKLLKTPLLNCRRNLEHKHCLTFFKFIKVTFKIISTTIFQEESVELYVSIQKILQQKIQEMQNHAATEDNSQTKPKRFNQVQKYYLNKLWTDKLQLQFLILYKEKRQLLDVRNELRKQYPQQKMYFTIASLRSKLYKIIRISLKKLSIDYLKCTNEKIPSPIKINDIKLRYIMRSPDALASRLVLIDLYLCQIHNESLICKTITTINAFLSSKQQIFRQSQIKQKRQIVSSNYTL